MDWVSKRINCGVFEIVKPEYINTLLTLRKFFGCWRYPAGVNIVENEVGCDFPDTHDEIVVRYVVDHKC